MLGRGSIKKSLRNRIFRRLTSFLAELAAGVSETCGKAAGLGHEQQRNALRAGTGDHDNPAAGDTLGTCFAVEVANFIYLSFVGNSQFVYDAVLLQRELSRGKRRNHVGVERIVFRGNVAPGHAVAAVVASGASFACLSERGLANVNDRYTQRLGPGLDGKIGAF